jgi:hypothetical protein
MVQMRIIVGLVSVVLFLMTFEFIRKRLLREEYAILWLVTSLVVAVLSLWPGLVPLISKVTGFFYLTAIFIIGFVFLIALLMHYSIVISRIKEVNKELIQRFGLLELRIREFEETAREGNQEGDKEALS